MTKRIEDQARRMIAAASFTSALLTTLTACTAIRPMPTTELDIARATATPVVAFQTEGGPLDQLFPSDERLTLANALQCAVASDPRLQATLARVRIAMAEADQARLLPNPMLNLALRFPEQGGTAVIEASLAQDIISILRRPRQASSADNRMQQASADALNAGLDAASEVLEKYATVQALDELMPVLEQRRALLGKLVEVAQARLDAQEGTRDDLVTLQSQFVEVELEIAEQNQHRLDERLQLAKLIGQPSSPAAWTLDPWVSAAIPASAESAWIEAALRHRPEIQSVAWQMAALQDEQALTHLLPFDGAEAGIAAERDGRWTTGPEIALPLPVFDIGQARRARVTAQQIEARHQLTQAQRQVVEDVRRSHGSLLRSKANLQRVETELIPLQQQRRTLAESAYRNGLSDVTPLFLAEQELRAAEAKRIEFRRQTAIALVRLQRAVGGAGVAQELTSDATAPQPTNKTAQQRGAN